MAGGRILPTGQRLHIQETSPGVFTWSIYSVDGKTIILAGAMPYKRYDGAERGGMTAYKNQQKLLSQQDPTPERKQKIYWKDHWPSLAPKREKSDYFG